MATDISKIIYQTLTAKQRAVAVYAAFNREDHVETSRLIGHAPKSGGHGKEIFAISQAVKTYGIMMSKATTELQRLISHSLAANSFCLGWAAAGGAPDNPEYLGYRMIAELMAPAVEDCRGVLNSVRQAGAEWCETNGIPLETLSSKCGGVLPPKIDPGAPRNEESLAMMRSLFNSITLSW